VLRLILTRLVAGVLVLVCVATFAFFMLRAAPGGPFDEERQLQPEVKANIERRYHLDQPVWTQYWTYMKGLAHGDLGHSMKRSETVNEIIASHYGYSLRVGLLALLFAMLAGVSLGVVAAVRQNTIWDATSMAIALFGISMPSFVLGPLLIYVFSLQLGWFPPARLEGIYSLVLPAMTLGLIYMGAVARLARGGMLETLRQDYIRTARAKGLSERVVVWKHAIRLGLLPVITYLGPALAALIIDSFVVDKIFHIPGLGFYFFASIPHRD